MANLRAAVIGLGVMGRNHVRVLSNLEGVELVAVVEPQEGSENVTSGIQVLRTVEELVSSRIDYCVIAAPTAFHEEIAAALIGFGVNLLIEKPVAHSSAAADRIQRAAAGKVIVGVGHIERYNAAVQQVRSRISNGDIGEIYQISTRRQGPFPSRISDVGVVMDLATHDIDLTKWIANSDYKSVAAKATKKSGRKHEDLVVAVAELESGVIVNHVVNWINPLKERETVITGEKGTFVVNTLTSDLTYYENGSMEVSQESLAHFKGVTQGDIRTYSFNKPEPLRTEHENFRDHLNGKKSEIVTLESGCSTVRIAESFMESASTGKIVDL